MKNLALPPCRAIAPKRFSLAATALAALFCCATPAGAAVEPVQAVSEFFPATNGDALRYVQPYITRSGIGQVGDVVRNTVTIRLKTFDRYNATQAFVDGTVIFTLDGVPISPQVSSPYEFSWNTTGVADGTHALGVILVDGPPDLAIYRATPTQVVVDNVPGVVEGPQRLPLLGNSVSLNGLVSATPDWIDFPGFDARPHATPRPLPYRYSPPVAGIADPLSAITPGKWFLESLTEGNTGLYQGKPAFFRNAEGHPVTNVLYQQDGAETSSSAPIVRQTPNHDGERNDNSVSPYSTYVPDPNGPGWVGIDIAGRLFRVAPDGDVRTIAGSVTDRNQVPFDKLNRTIPEGLFASTRISIGDFDGNVGFNAPTDLAFDPRNPSIIYVADYLNHRIAKVDLSVTPPRISTFAGAAGVAGNVDGPVALARFDEPSSIVAAPDGTLFVADQENHSIRKISADGRFVSTLAAQSASVAFAPFAIRLNSRGELIVAEFFNNTVSKVSTTTGAISLFARLSGCMTAWTWLDVDFRGTVGPKDDAIVACSTGGVTRVFRISVDGKRVALWPTGSGSLEQGGLSAVVEPAGHYPWAVAIDDEESKLVFQGFGNLGLRQLRMVQPGDPSFLRYSQDMYNPVGLGRGIMLKGSVRNFPFGVRPSFTALLGATGHGHLGNVKNFDDLALMSDAELTAYIQGGMGGSVPRPEITGRDLDAFIYYIRINSLQGLTSTVPLPKSRPDITPPQVSDVVINPLPDGTLEVTWKTSEPAIGFVAFGTSPRYHRWSPVESGFATTHRAVLTDFSNTKAVNLAIMARDETGNQTFTANRVYTGGRVFLPTLLLQTSATAVAYNGTAKLTWSSTGATACVASGNWTGSKPVQGVQSTVLLKANSTFVLTCTGAGGSVSKTVNVAVAPPANLPSLTFTATPTAVALGARATLSWSAANATACTAGGNWSGAKPVSGTEQSIVINASKAFSLICSGPGGSVTRSVVVSVSGSTSSSSVLRPGGLSGGVLSPLTP